MLLRAHICVQKKPRSFKVAPKDHRLYGIGRRTAAVSIHMCVWQKHMSTQGLHRGSKRYRSSADQILLRPGAAASTHMCVSEKTPFIQGCTQGSKVVWGRPTNCCCKHTHVCMAESHVNSRLAPRIKKVQEFGRPTAAASIHICVSETVPGCTQGSQVTRDWPTNCENMSSQGCTQGPRVTSVWPTACCCEHTHVCCKIKSIQGCTQGRHVTRVRPTRCCCEPTHMRCRIFLFNVARKGQKIICRCEHTYTHVCFRTSQFKLAHQKQEVQGLGQSGAAVSTHVRAAG